MLQQVEGIATSLWASNKELTLPLNGSKSVQVTLGKYFMMPRLSAPTNPKALHPQVHSDHHQTQNPHRHARQEGHGHDHPHQDLQNHQAEQQLQ